MKFASRIFVLVITMLPLLAAAQFIPSHKIAAEVPFEFAVGNKIVPAGHYSVKVNSYETTVAIENQDGGLFSLVSRDEAREPASNPELIFHRYGDRVFLWGVKLDDSRTIYRLPTSKAEAELRARNAVPREEILTASSR